MMPELHSAALLAPLSEHPNWRALASLVRASAIDATLARRTDFASRHRLGGGPATGPGHIPEGLTRKDADTPYGNVLDVLERGVESPEERALLGALLALAIESDPPLDTEASVELGGHLVWLAAHTPCDALASLDALAGISPSDVWSGVARAVNVGVSDSAFSDFGATEALVAAAALRRSHSPEARALRFEKHAQVTDPALEALLAPPPDELADELLGELQPPPRGPLLTSVLAVTLLLFLSSVFRLIARYAFAYRRPASLRLGPQGLELNYRIEVMGRVLRDRSTLIPVANLSRVTREVRYSGASLYAGLSALTLGTYFGTGLFVDGIRVPGGSAPLLGLAVLFIVIGLGADFVLNSGGDAVRGRCRLVIAPSTGRTLCLGAIDPGRADELLRVLAEHTRSGITPRTEQPEPTVTLEPAERGPTV